MSNVNQINRVLLGYDARKSSTSVDNPRVPRCPKLPNCGAFREQKVPGMDHIPLARPLVLMRATVGCA
jgi:hypothetical protein